MSEELKHYEIQVGTQTRAGNMNVVHRFVAMSDKDSESVRIFYTSKYSGLTVRVQLITDVVSDNIPTAKDTYDYGSSENERKISSLEWQIEKLNEAKLDSFSGEIPTSDLDIETKSLIKEFGKMLNALNERKTAVRERVENFISERYGSTIIYEVNIDDFNPMAGYFKFTAKLRGRIYRSPLKNK